MRVVSEWQPWGTLIIRRLKVWETRSWEIEYRGPIAIHAAKQKYRPEQVTQEFRTEMLFDEVDTYGLPYGVVLGVVDVLDCQPTEKVRGALGPKELLYGDYSDGRFAWKMGNVRAFEKPIPLTGRQGIFHWPEGESVLHLAKPVPEPLRLERRVG